MLAYWFVSTKWGIHEQFGPKEDEWKIRTPDELKTKFPVFDNVCGATIGIVLLPPTAPILKKIQAWDPKRR